MTVESPDNNITHVNIPILSFQANTIVRPKKRYLASIPDNNDKDVRVKSSLLHQTGPVSVEHSKRSTVITGGNCSMNNQTDRKSIIMAEFNKHPFFLYKNQNQQDTRNVIYLPPMTASDIKKSSRPKITSVKLHNPNDSVSRSMKQASSLFPREYGEYRSK